MENDVSDLVISFGTVRVCSGSIGLLFLVCAVRVDQPRVGNVFGGCPEWSSSVSYLQESYIP